MPCPGPGFYFYTSDDLINWSQAKLLMKAELPWTWQCSDGPQFYRDPSLLDPQSTTRNFDTMGQRPYLFFTRFNLSSCASSLDRDLIRIPIEFSNQAPGGPAATLAASNAAPRTGEAVTFDASGSRDEDGSITKFEWDLDGDGTYERDTGSSPVAGKTYSAADSVTVTVRVSDDDGKATDETMVVRVGGPGEAPEMPPESPRPPPSERWAVPPLATLGAWSSCAHALAEAEPWSGCGFPRRGCCACARPAERGPSGQPACTRVGRGS